MQEAEYLDLLQEEIVQLDLTKHLVERKVLEVQREVLMTLAGNLDLATDLLQDRADLILQEVG